MKKIIDALKKNNRQSLFWILFFCILSLLFSACSGINSQNDPGETGNFDFKTTDLSKFVLTPDDVKDIFPSSTYSITQENKTAQSRIFTSTFPVAEIEHTSAFSEG